MKIQILIKPFTKDLLIFIKFCIHELGVPFDFTNLLFKDFSIFSLLSSLVSLSLSSSISNSFNIVELFPGVKLLFDVF